MASVDLGKVVPERGVDYFTPADIEYVADIISRRPTVDFLTLDSNIFYSENMEDNCVILAGTGCILNTSIFFKATALSALTLNAYIKGTNTGGATGFDRSQIINDYGTTFYVWHLGNVTTIKNFPSATTTEFSGTLITPDTPGVTSTDPNEIVNNGTYNESVYMLQIRPSGDIWLGINKIKFDADYDNFLHPGMKYQMEFRMGYNRTVSS